MNASHASTLPVSPEDHLHPTDDGETLADDPVRDDDSFPDARSFEDVQFEKDAHRGLTDHVPPQVTREVGVGRHVERPTGVVVSEEVAREREDDADRLDRDVEPGPSHAEDHADGKQDAPAKDLDPVSVGRGLSGDSRGLGWLQKWSLRSPRMERD